MVKEHKEDPKNGIKRHTNKKFAELIK